MTTQPKNQILIFNGLYAKYYPLFAWRCERSVKDDVAASGMVQDAFLRVWLLRDQLSVNEVYDFLKVQLKKSIYAYYDTAKNRFHANLFRLDELENPNFLLVDGNLEEEALEEPNLADQLEKQKQWEQLNQLVANLTDTQQQLIKLCLKYNFSYDHIASYLGGISDYAVKKKVEVLLESLKRMLSGNQKLQQVSSKRPLVFNGSLDELQESIMQMRYELQYSFEEIAKALNLEQGYIQQAFVKAMTMKG